MAKRKAFTLIELMIIVGIIGLLASIILVVWAISAQNKAAISSYKTSMDSIRAAVEMCTGEGGTAMSGAPGARICDYNKDGTPDGSELYPILSSKCGNISQFNTIGGEGNWAVTTNTGCRDCLLFCTVTGCIEAQAGTCD